MPKTLLNVFEDFCDDLVPTVRNDLSFIMVMLSDEEIVVEELEQPIDERARALFGARVFVGRLGNLINAVSIFDVYFALDTNERFALYKSKRESGGLQGDATLSHLHHSYADRRQAIMELRRMTLSPEAIATALLPASSIPRWNPLASAMRANVE